MSLLRKTAGHCMRYLGRPSLLCRRTSSGTARFDGSTPHSVPTQDWYVQLVMHATAVDDPSTAATSAVATRDAFPATHSATEETTRSKNTYELIAVSDDVDHLFFL